MNGRSAASLLAFVTLVAAGLAGCVEAPSFLTNSDSEASAKENRDLADSAAAAWNPDAALVAVMTFEAGSADAEEGAGAIPVDPSVGNGRALLWFYGYQTPGGNETRLFRVTADGAVEVENTTGIDMGPVTMKPVDKWNVDSDAAVDAARADERFEEVVGAENASMMMVLGSEEGHSKWMLLAHAGGKMVAAAVDADTGALLMVEKVDFDDMVMPDVPTPPGFDMGAPVHLEGSGRLDSATRVVEVPFTYGGRNDEGVLEISTRKTVPGEGLWYSLVGPDGEAIAEGSLMRLVTPSGSATVEFEMEGPGEYLLVLGYDTVAGMAPVPVPLAGVDYEFMLHVGPEMEMPYVDAGKDE